MVLKLSGHVRNTICLLYMQKTGWNSDIWNFFSEKMDFLSILVYVHWKSDFWVRPCLKTSLWRHTLTDFHDFGINGKRRPYPIPWYQTITLWARQFQVHRGGNHPPLVNHVTKKGLVGRGLKEKDLSIILSNSKTHNKSLPNVITLLQHVDFSSKQSLDLATFENKLILVKYYPVLEY